MKMSPDPMIAAYMLLIEQFVGHQLTGLEFEAAYLALHRTDKGSYAENIHLPISKLFSDVDEYCGDPNIADYDTAHPFHDIDESELRRRAAVSLQDLKDAI